MSHPFAHLPHVISFPRSGSHWINCALELYSGRPRSFQMAPRERVITMLPPNAGDDFLFHHAHGVPGESRPAKVAYIVRDPVDVIYSFTTAHNATPQNIDRFIGRAVKGWNHSVNRWVHGADRADVIVRYEEMVASPVELKKLTDWLGLEWDESKADKALKSVTKDKLAQQNRLPKFFGPHLVTAAYAAGREAFRAAHGERIYSMTASVSGTS